MIRTLRTLCLAVALLAPLSGCAAAVGAFIGSRIGHALHHTTTTTTCTVIDPATGQQQCVTEQS